MVNQIWVFKFHKVRLTCHHRRWSLPTQTKTNTSKDLFQWIKILVVEETRDDECRYSYLLWTVFFLFCDEFDFYMFLLILFFYWKCSTMYYLSRVIFFSFVPNYIHLGVYRLVGFLFVDKFNEIFSSMSFLKSMSRDE